MMEHVFSPEMMKKREEQLVLALADCVGTYYDVNFTKNRILRSTSIVVNGVEYSIHELAGLSEDCSYTDAIAFWGNRVNEDERNQFFDTFNLDNIKECFHRGEHYIVHKCWSRDHNENPIFVVLKVRLYKENDSGDIYGFVYATDENELDVLIEKDALLMEKYAKASASVSLLEKLSANVPGGYHRCGTTGGFKLQFLSQSFLDVVGWTKEEIENELNNDYINIVAPEDRDFFMSHEPILRENGRVELVYRVRRNDGTRRWIQDATIRTEKDGEEFYQCTLMDITEYVEKLNAEKERAEASNQAKSTFLFNASHDIRTPMNAIQGYARIIAENVNNPKIVEDAVQKIMQSGEMLSTLVNDVLEISRIERGKSEVEQRPIDMREHIDKLYEMFTFDMSQAGINFYMENQIEHDVVVGDDLKLTRIAMNLLSNARKFTPVGGNVTFGIKESGYDGEKAYYMLYVKDTGIGMSKEFQQRAFEQFERERTSTESGVAGSGLGLAIIKRLCELMDGEYHIDSELGKGTEITVKIPLKIAKERLDIRTDKVNYDSFRGKRVLLVEDNEFNREIATYTLESVEFVVEEAEDGHVAVDKVLKAEAGYYDLILMDIQMPIMDGYTATKEIRHIHDEKKAGIPIIAMTANAFDEDKERCLAAGMNGHIGKPLDVDALMKEIAKAL